MKCSFGPLFPLSLIQCQHIVLTHDIDEFQSMLKLQCDSLRLTKFKKGFKEGIRLLLLVSATGPKVQKIAVKYRHKQKSRKIMGQSSIPHYIEEAPSKPIHRMKVDGQCLTGLVSIHHLKEARKARLTGIESMWALRHANGGSCR